MYIIVGGAAKPNVNMEGQFVYRFEAALITSLLLFLTIFLTVFCLCCRYREFQPRRRREVTAKNRGHVEECKVLLDINDNDSLSSQEDGEDILEASSTSCHVDESVTFSVMKPGKPRAIKVSFDSIELEWTKLEQSHSAHNVPTSYTIFGSISDTPHQWTKQNTITMTSGDEMCEKMCVTELAEDTTYCFKIQPESHMVGSVLESDISEPIKTKQITPSQPGKPWCSSIGHDCVQLEWKNPEQGAHNIVAYHISYHSHNDPQDKWIKKEVKSAKERVTISHLLEKTIYSFKVRPECKDGLGLESDTSDAIQTKMIIPSKPSKPTATGITHNSIQLEWTEPEEGAHNVTSYTIFYRSISDPSDVWSEQKAATNKEVLVAQLSENTVYNFKIRPECETGIGLESDTSDAIQTKMIIPSKPGKPIATGITHNSIQLEWTEPEEGAHNVISYTIFFCSISDPSDVWSEQKAATNKEVLVAQLSENMVYNFKIRPECETGIGLESDTSDPIQTKMIIPSKPGKPTATGITHNSIQLEWTEPEEGAHNVTSYTIFYRSISDPSGVWSKQKAATNKEVLVAQLSENTVYNFKIRPECETGIGLESDTSDAIQTKMIIPSKPGKPTATGITHNSIQLEWTEPEEGAHNVTSYTIFYRSISDPSDVWSEQKAATNKEVLVAQLSENTVYNFTIRPEYETGIGLESDTSDPIQTKMIIPSKPGKPTATGITHSSIQLEWTEPEEGAHNVTSYTIFYRSISDPSGVWSKQKAATNKEVLVTQLSENTVYNFKIRPECETGIGLESDTSDAIQTKMIIPSKPSKPTATGIIHNSIQLEWTEPEEGAHNVISYTIFFRSVSDPSDVWSEQKAATNKEVLVAQLSENTVYNFKIRPECETGIGLESDTSDAIQTKMIIPSKPSKPTATGITHNSIQLEWTEPEEGAHNVTSYTIFYHSISDPSGVWSEQKAATNKEVLVAQLSENTVYNFKIRPECETGIGLESDTSDPIQTKMIIPSKPGKPTATVITHNSIEIEWTKPEEGDHNVTSYVIFYRCANDPWTQVKAKIAKEKATMSKLFENTMYSFKIQPEYEGGAGAKSDASEHIRTKRILEFADAYHRLWSARGKWYAIGLRLGLDRAYLDVLDSTKTTHPQAIENCYRYMLARWYDDNIDGNSQMLIDALCDETVGFSNLAESIASEIEVHPCIPTCDSNVQCEVQFECPLCGMCSFEEYLKKECPKFHSSSDLAFPFLDTSKLTEEQTYTLHMKLLEETDDINEEFKDLVYRMTNSIDEMSSQKLQRVANFVKYRLSIPNSSLGDNPADVTKQYLKETTSFLNYSNVQKLIAEFGTDEDKKRLSSYETCFKNYCNRSVFEVPKAVFGPPPRHSQMFAFKLIDRENENLPLNNHGYLNTAKKNAKALGVSLNEALRLQKRIAKVLGIENSRDLVFIGISKGCIELKFSAPVAILDTVKKQHDVETLEELPGFADLEETEDIHIMCGPPGKPYAISVKSNSIHLQWSKLEHRGSHPVKFYSVDYKSLKDPSAKWRTVQSKAFVENLEIGRLSQNETPFVFRVQAVNTIGAGIPSEESDPINLMRPPFDNFSIDFPSKPGKPQAVSITHDSIQLEWTKPEKSVKSAISYTVLYRSQFNDPPYQWVEIRAASTKERVIVSHLLENTTYLFQVLPECEDGAGLESDISDPITTKMILPSKPGKPRVTNASHDSVQLEWTKPEEGSHNITSYTILYRSANDPSDQWISMKTKVADEKVTLIMQLSKETEYYFKVKAECEEGFGVESDISEPSVDNKPGKSRGGCI